MRHIGLAAAAGAAVLVTFTLSQPAVAQTRSAGAMAWAQCSACHSLDKGAPNKVGPNLHGIVGKKAGQVAGFNYSPALKKSTIIWTEKELDRWIMRPSLVVKGHKMAFAGIANAERRKLIIDYMKTGK